MRARPASAPSDFLLSPVQLASVFKGLRNLNDSKSRASYAEGLQPGNYVTLYSFDDNRKYQFKLVQPDNAKADSGQISYLSPLGSQLLGAKAGTLIAATIAGRRYDFRVLSIED